MAGISASKPMTEILRGRTALVTGGGSGIGAAIALALARSGADVWLVGRRLEKLHAIAEQVRRLGVRATCHSVDLADADAVADLGQRFRADQAHLDILVHSAARFARATIEQAAIEDLDAIYRTNVRAPFALTRALLDMLKASQGQVVFVNSSSGHTAKATTAQYDASKHALKALADSLRAEVNEHGIRVASFYLGRTASEMQARVHALEGKPYRPEVLLQAEDVAAVVVQALTLPRTAEVTDVHIRPMLKG